MTTQLLSEGEIERGLGLTRAEHALLARAAQRAGQSLAQWLRTVAIAAAQAGEAP